MHPVGDATASWAFGLVAARRRAHGVEPVDWGARAIDAGCLLECTGGFGGVSARVRQRRRRTIGGVASRSAP